MSMNLKYSDNPLQDYKKLSTGRKLYIEKRAAKKSVSVKTYLSENNKVTQQDCQWSRVFLLTHILKKQKNL